MHGTNYGGFMRVSLVTETFFPQLNGVSRTLGQLAGVLEAAGDEVQVVHPDYGEPARDDRVHLVRASPLPFYRDVHLPLPPFGRVHRAVDAFRPDVIHIATEATLGLSVLRHAMRRRIPVVSSFHTNFDQYSRHYGIGWARGIICRYLRWFHNRTRETYVPSRATISDLEALGFQRLVLWPRGVDSHLFRPDRPGRAAIRQALGFAPDEVVIGYVGRIAREKNVPYLGLALKRVAEQRPNVGFLFVGDGPSRPDLERMMGPRGRFAGYQTGEALADHYAACDVFAFASLTETFGNVILEAMASGLAVVAVRAGGVGDILESGNTGTLVEPGQPPEAMADALINLIDDREMLRRVADVGRAHALQQSWVAIMGTLRERYQKVIVDAAAGAASPAFGLG
jgi:glycosyltransferase involved in cell wall biosynthesis